MTQLAILQAKRDAAEALMALHLQELSTAQRNYATARKNFKVALNQLVRYRESQDAVAPEGR